MADSTWYKPICDSILNKVIVWRRDYTKGVVYASKSFMTVEGRVEDRPTIYACKLRFTAAELKHLVRLLEALIPKLDVTDKIKAVESSIQNNRSIFKLVPPNYYEFTLAIYPTQVEEVYQALVQAKAGVAKIADLVKDQDEGKSPFEL